MDGRYGENPFRFQHYFQYQVILKPAPDDVLDQYFGSLEALGIDLRKHDIRLVEDDWEQPTLGAWGLGWEVWCDAMEVTQFTYFQQLGGIDLEIIPAEMTYGLERLGLFLQGKKSVFELEWAPGVSWGDVYRENERQWSQYNYEEAPVDVLQRRFAEHEAEAEELAREEAAAAGLRPGAEVVARVQPARRARRRLGDRARGVHRPGPEARAPLRPALRGGRWRRSCLRSAARSCRPAPAARPRRSCPSSAERVLGVEPSRVLITPRRLALLVDDVPERTSGRVAQGPAGGDAGEGRGRVCEAARRLRGGARGARRLPGRRVAREASRRGLAGAASTGSSAGSRSRRRCAGTATGFASRGPFAGRCAMIDAANGRRRELAMAIASHPARSTIPDASSYIDTLRKADVEPDALERRKQIVDALDDLGGWTDPNGVLGEVVFLVEKPVVIEGRFDERYLQLPSRVVETTIQHHIRASSRSARTASPSSRTAATRTPCGPGSRTSSRAASRTRRSRSSATSRSGSTTWPSGSARSRSSQGAGSFADKTERLGKLVEALGGGEAALEAARLAKADQASELVREFTELEGHIGGEYARLAGYPEAVSAAIDEQYLPDGADAPAAADRDRARARRPRTRSTRSTSPSGSGSGRPARVIPTGCGGRRSGSDRLATEGNLSIPRELMDPEVAEFVEERFEGLLEAPGRVRARGSARLGARPRRRRAARPGARRLARGAVRAHPHGVHAREPARGEGGRRRGAARSRSPHRGGRGRSGRRRSSGSTRRSRRHSMRATSPRRSSRPPSSGRCSTASSRRCSSSRRTAPCARIAYACCSTCGTRSAASASCRKSRALIRAS